MTIISYTNIFLLLSLTTICFANQDETGFTYEYADVNHVKELSQLINQEVIEVSDRLVVLPQKFRQDALKDQIEKERLFIAKDGEEIIGFKKLFVVTDPTEQNDILTNELRCQGDSVEHLYTGIYTESSQLPAETPLLPSFSLDNTTIIYNGGDFTKARYRQKGVNRSLMKKALEFISSQVTNEVETKNSNRIAMVYGLTNVIAGVNDKEEKPGDTTDRTSSIVKSFNEFAQQLHPEMQALEIKYDRFKAFKPSFDPNAQKCAPLPDEDSVEGRGCILSYQLSQTFMSEQNEQ